jgi:hypothetical protein
MKASNRTLVLAIFLIPGCLVAPIAEMPVAEGGDEEVDPTGSEGAEGADESDESDGTEPPGSDEGMTFVMENDVPYSNECSVGSDECGPGRKCTFYRNEVAGFLTVCADLVDDPLEVGAICELGSGPGEDACSATAVCWDAMADGVGVCLDFCGEFSNWGCDAGFACNTFKDLGDGGMCTPICHPMADECPGTCGCFYTGSQFQCVPLTENIPTGEPCGFVNDCAMDHYCVAAESMPDCAGSACCASFCQLGLGSACEQAGTECVAFYDEGEAPPGFEDVGVCILPVSP